MANQQRNDDSDLSKGGVEQDRPEQDTNVSDRVHVLGTNQGSQRKINEDEVNPEYVSHDHEPGERQGQNQNQERDDPLAA